MFIFLRSFTYIMHMQSERIVMCLSMVATTVFFNRGPPTWCKDFSTYGIHTCTGQLIAHVTLGDFELPIIIKNNSGDRALSRVEPSTHQECKAITNSTLDTPKVARIRHLIHQKCKTSRIRHLTHQHACFIRFVCWLCLRMLSYLFAGSFCVC
jgi:hypothetical protein